MGRLCEPVAWSDFGGGVRCASPAPRARTAFWWPFGLEILKCGKCGGKREVLACIVRPSEVKRICAHPRATTIRTVGPACHRLIRRAQRRPNRPSAPRAQDSPRVHRQGKYRDRPPCHPVAAPAKKGPTLSASAWPRASSHSSYLRPKAGHANQHSPNLALANPRAVRRSSDEVAQRVAAARVNRYATGPCFITESSLCGSTTKVAPCARTRRGRSPKASR